MRLRFAKICMLVTAETVLKTDWDRTTPLLSICVTSF